jgi:hypothetical protein
MQYHSEFNHHRHPSADRTPWNIAERTGDPIVLDAFRRFASLRERLVGYLVEQSRLGRPLMRPLCFDFPHDARVWDFPLQYQLGDDLLVAPVTEPDMQTWSVYLPAGQWRDIFTGTVHSGPTVVHRNVPRDEIPVYAGYQAPPSWTLSADQPTARRCRNHGRRRSTRATCKRFDSPGPPPEVSACRSRPASRPWCRHRTRCR